jgi:microcystin degradation protein MlrC
MARIAVGGFQHETNTFAPLKATWAMFEEVDGWPGFSRGRDLLPAIEGVHLPITGAVAALRGMGHEIVPLSWCAATPSAHVTEDAFERIAAVLLEDIASAGHLDGIYLDLHGAAVTEHLEDGEGELLRRIRALVGDGVPISVSLDLHANVTEEMVALADVMDAFRTYPHVDMGETGARAARHLDALLRGEGPFHKAMRKPNFLIPLNWGCSYIEPAASLYRLLPEIETASGAGLTAISFATGFPMADIREVGPAVFAYGRDRAATEAAVETMTRAIHAAEPNFAGRIWQPDEAVAEAMRIAASARKPVVLADTQDNSGAGGSSDTTGLLEALIRGGARGAVLGLLNDPQVALQAHEAGEGATIRAGLGGKSGMVGHPPLAGDYHVLKLGDGHFTGTGPMWHGARMELGPMALLEIAGVRVAVGSIMMQAADQSIFRHLGVEPAEAKVLALKSSVHFRADFQPICEEILVVEAPGPCAVDPSKLPFSKVRPGLRLKPGGD